jgi:hypothetical protein
MKGRGVVQMKPLLQGNNQNSINKVVKGCECCGQVKEALIQLYIEVKVRNENAI